LVGGQQRGTHRGARRHEGAGVPEDRGGVSAKLGPGMEQHDGGQVGAGQVCFERRDQFAPPLGRRLGVPLHEQDRL